jgi:hypothetical protein
MADIDRQDISEVIDLEPEAVLSLEEPPELAPDDFDEDTYLRAFPDVAKAIADGVCTSSLRHYMDHGRHEDRIAHYSHLLEGRRIEGHIDFYGHNSLAGGWMFCGWAAERWDETKTARAVARFANGNVTGLTITAFYRRDGLRGPTSRCSRSCLGVPTLAPTPCRRSRRSFFWNSMR